MELVTKTSSFPFLLSSSSEEEEAMAVVEAEPAVAMNKRKLLSKQLSMRETTREAKWEKRRQQMHDRRRRMTTTTGAAVCEEEDVEEEEEEEVGRGRSLTDEDLDELRGSIELGFGFDEENGGHSLRDTLPALDLYFAVNRQLSDPKLWSSPTPSTGTSSSTTTANSSCSNLLGGTPSPRSPHEQASDPWRICSPGDDPQHVKMRLRQWAQVVACSVRHSC